MTANHVVIDLDGVRGCPMIDDVRECIRMFLIAVCRAIKMNLLYNPVICEGGADNPGVTGFLLIDTSHIAVHQFDVRSQVRIDIYSCKPFPQEVPVALAEIYFPADLVRVQVIDRWPVEMLAC